MTFEAWLLKQTKRDDPVGDLARDFRDAKRISPGLSKKREKCDEEYLASWDAIPDAYKALKQARSEYEKWNVINK